MINPQVAVTATERYQDLLSQIGFRDQSAKFQRWLEHWLDSVFRRIGWTFLTG